MNAHHGCYEHSPVLRIPGAFPACARARRRSSAHMSEAHEAAELERLEDARVIQDERDTAAHPDSRHAAGGDRFDE